MHAPMDLSTRSAAKRSAVLALNQRYQAEMSSLTQASLDQLIASSAYARSFGDVDGFLIAFDQSSVYAGENFRWFKARFDRFVYVDRVAVAPASQGQGIAKALYADLFTWTSAQGHSLVTCEVNIDPPNPASARLHNELGFRQIDTAVVSGGAKTVAYLTHDMSAS